MENNSNKDDIGLLNEIVQQNRHLVPMVTDHNERSIELYREIMMSGENGERDFKEMVNEFIQLIEKQLSNAEMQIFDIKYVISKMMKF
jgi:hypothetical protein